MRLFQVSFCHWTVDLHFTESHRQMVGPADQIGDLSIHFHLDLSPADRAIYVVAMLIEFEQFDMRRRSVREEYVLRLAELEIDCPMKDFVGRRSRGGRASKGDQAPKRGGEQTKWDSRFHGASRIPSPERFAKPTRKPWASPSDVVHGLSS